MMILIHEYGDTVSKYNFAFWVGTKWCVGVCSTHKTPFWGRGLTIQFWASCKSPTGMMFDDGIMTTKIKFPCWNSTYHVCDTLPTQIFIKLYLMNSESWHRDGPKQTSPLCTPFTLTYYIKNAWNISNVGSNLKWVTRVLEVSEWIEW